MAKIKYFCLLLIFVGIASKFYGFADPWKTHDHYNFGGVWTTTYAECLKLMPLKVSRGIPAVDCWTDHPSYYRAHPPTILFALWGWTSIFGSSEAAYRGFILLFSVLNIFLVYRIAKRARPESPLFALLAATMQSGFLGGLYFGTHLDFIGEFTVFFVLLSAYWALAENLTLAALAALLAGISAWPGYLAFIPLTLYAFLICKGRKRVLFTGLIGLATALATMMWLQQTVSILEFLTRKLFHPGYIKPREKGINEPALLLLNILHSLSRLLSPLLASWAILELGIRIQKLRKERGRFLQTLRKDRFSHAVFLSGGTGLVYLLLGHEYFMVHVFLYLLMVPGLALLAARLFEDLLAQGADAVFPYRWPATFLTLGFAACYPYGIYQTNRWHDVGNSVLFAMSCLIFLIWLWRKRLPQPLIMSLLAICVIANISQMMNYRNEPDTERSFCEQARRSYMTTGRPVVTDVEESSAKDFLYCRGVPIIYRKPADGAGSH